MPPEPVKKIRSPGRLAAEEMWCVWPYCDAALCERWTRNRPKTYMVKPEQSNVLGPAAPYWYGAPWWRAPPCSTRSANPAVLGFGRGGGSPFTVVTAEADLSCRRSPP